MKIYVAVAWTAHTGFHSRCGRKWRIASVISFLTLFNLIRSQCVRDVVVKRFWFLAFLVVEHGEHIKLSRFNQNHRQNLLFYDTTMAHMCVFVLNSHSLALCFDFCMWIRSVEWSCLTIFEKENQQRENNFNFTQEIRNLCVVHIRWAHIVSHVFKQQTLTHAHWTKQTLFVLWWNLWSTYDQLERW